MRALREFIIRLFLREKPKGVMTTLPNKDLVDMNIQIVAEKLMRNGIDPNSLKNANQVENAINMIDNRPKVQEGITATKSAKIMDMEGKEIDPRSKIMGGKQAETEEEILERLNKENKEGIEGLKQKMRKEKARTQRISGNLRANNANRTEIGKPKLDKDEYDYYKEILGEDPEVDYYPVKGDETKEMLDAMVKEAKDEMDYMKRLYDKGALDPPEDFAQGGRAGFAAGGMSNFIIRLLGNFIKINKRKPDSDEVEKIIREAADMDIQRSASNAPINYKSGGDMFGSPSDEYRENVGGGIRAITRRTDQIDRDKVNKLADKIESQMPVRAQEEFDFAQGGIARLGFKDGMTRRTFLKILGGAMSIPIIGKFLKPMKVGKTVTKVPMIKTDDVAGKPEWFDALVNKVIVEGDDVTKKFATGERQSIHQKTLDDGSVVRVTEDVDDGAIRVEYQSEKNVFGDDVQLQYKKPLPDEGDPRPTAEFTTAESGPVGRSYGPDDYEIELDEVGGTSIKDLDSDVSKLKEYATGKKPTMTEIVQNKKRRDKAKAISEDPEAQSDAVIRRQGEFIQFEDIDPNMASGGIARLLGE